MRWPFLGRACTANNGPATSDASIPYALGGVERLIEVQGKELDVEYVRRELSAMMGDDDERVRRWDELTQAKAHP